MISCHAYRPSGSLACLVTLPVKNSGWCGPWKHDSLQCAVTSFDPCHHRWSSWRSGPSVLSYFVQFLLHSWSPIIVGSSSWYSANVAASSASVVVGRVLMLWDRTHISVAGRVGSGRWVYPVWSYCGVGEGCWGVVCVGGVGVVGGVMELSLDGV